MEQPSNSLSLPPGDDSSIAITPSLSVTQRSFLTNILPRLQKISTETGLPLNYLLAQSAHETGWGVSSAYNKGFNLFGVGAGGPKYYQSADEADQAYIALMNSDRYKGVTRKGTPGEIGDAMAVAGYNPAIMKDGVQPPGG